MTQLRTRIDAAAAYLRDAVPGKPCCAVFASPATAASFDGSFVSQHIAFRAIAGFADRAGAELALTRVGDSSVLVAPLASSPLPYGQGHDIIVVLKALQALGVQSVLIAGDAIATTDTMAPNDVMVVRDHINLTGDNPLIGCFDEAFDSCFVDMSAPYSEELAARILGKMPGAKGPEVHEGTLLCVARHADRRAACADIIAACSPQSVAVGVAPEILAATWAGLAVLVCMRITMVRSGVGKAIGDTCDNWIADQPPGDSQALFWSNCIQKLAA